MHHPNTVTFPAHCQPIPFCAFLLCIDYFMRVLPMMCPPSPSGVRLLFFDTMSSRRIPYWQRYLVRRAMDESVRFLRRSWWDPSYNSRPLVFGSLIRFLFCYSVFSLCAPRCFSSWIQLFALPCVALHVALHSWWLLYNIPAPFPVPSPA